MRPTTQPTRWICHGTWSEVNPETLPIAALESIQFGHVLDRILREIILADPALVPVYLVKLKIADGFYRINININNIPKLGVVFPTLPGEKPLIALPLILPMDSKNSLPTFSTATETYADLANQRLALHQSGPSHPLDDLAHSIESPPEPVPPSVPSKTPAAVPIPTHRDPALPIQDQPRSYVYVFVDDFVGLCQGKQNQRRVRRTLLRSINQVFRSLSPADPATRREPVSL